MSMAFKVLLICLGSIKMEFSIKGGGLRQLSNFLYFSVGIRVLKVTCHSDPEPVPTFISEFCKKWTKNFQLMSKNIDKYLPAPSV